LVPLYFWSGTLKGLYQTWPLNFWSWKSHDRPEPIKFLVLEIKWFIWFLERKSSHVSKTGHLILGHKLADLNPD
jgi:hypothetical protein